MTCLRLCSRQGLLPGVGSLVGKGSQQGQPAASPAPEDAVHRRLCPAL